MSKIRRLSNVGGFQSDQSYSSMKAGTFAKASGGLIYTDSAYVYHVFISNGTFTPIQSLIADISVIAGGGG